MERYDGIYIINPNLRIEVIKNIILEVNNIFSQNNSTNLEIEEWGVKQLPYEISGLKNGYYVKFTVNCDLTNVTEYDEFCCKHEDIIRHILIKK